MQDRRWDLLVATFSYGGNGGMRSEHPAVGRWLTKLVLAAKKDDRLGRIADKEFADTPIPMCRNAAARFAVENRFDLLLMVDSDMQPDLYLESDPQARPFFQTSLDFILKRHWDKGPCAVGAPYCGPEPHPVAGGSSNVYVFRWRVGTSAEEDRGFTLAQYLREEAAVRGGIEEVAALPTGLILIDTRIFTQGTPDEPGRPLLPPPWFDYEYTDEYRSAKASTEDVYFTRNCSLVGFRQYCNWDAWAGHIKPTVVGKPVIISQDQVRREYRDAVIRSGVGQKRLIDVNPEKSIDDLARELGMPPESFCLLNRGDDGQYRLAMHRMGQVDQAILRRISARAFKECDYPLTAVEVGSFAGESALVIDGALSEFPGGHRLFCVDTWEGSAGDVTGNIASAIGGSGPLLSLFKLNVGDRLDRTIFPIQGRSVDVARSWDKGPLDMLYIDASHEYEDVKADLLAWLPHVRPGGLVCGHDYEVEGFPGVSRAVDEVLGAVCVEGFFWWARKPEEKKAWVCNAAGEAVRLYAL